MPAGATYVVVVHEITQNAGCSSYSLSVTTSCQAVATATPNPNTPTPTYTPSITATPTDTLIPAGIGATPLESSVTPGADARITITAVGCHEGLSTGAGAEQVGRSTTRAVVISIFLVILVDLVFTALFFFLSER